MLDFDYEAAVINELIDTVDDAGLTIKFQAVTSNAVDRFLDTISLPEDAGSYIALRQYVYYNFMHNTQEANEEFIQGVVDLGFVVIGAV